MPGVFVLSIFPSYFAAVIQTFTNVLDLPCFTAATGHNPFIFGIRSPSAIGITGDFGEFLSISGYFGGIIFNEIYVVDSLLPRNLHPLAYCIHHRDFIIFTEGDYSFNNI